MANLYTIEKLLEGKEYRSQTLTGEIITAEKLDQTDFWFGADKQGYRVLVRTPHSYKDHYRILAVQVGE
jgi:hypothetical protein